MFSEKGPAYIALLCFLLLLELENKLSRVGGGVASYPFTTE